MHCRHPQIPRRLTFVSAAALCLAIGHGPALAQEGPEGFSVGVAIVGGNSIYVGEDSSVTPLPLLRYDTDRFSIGLPDGLRITAFERNQFRLSAVVSPRFSEIEASDAEELEGLDRVITFDGGVQARYRLRERTTLSFRGVTELTGEHGGSEVSAGLSQALPLGPFPVFVGGGIKWQSEGLSQYLYGVSASEATPGRPEYTPGDVFIPNVSLGTSVPITNRARVVANVQAEFLPEAVTDSPIVDEDVAIRGFLGVSYNF